MNRFWLWFGGALGLGLMLMLHIWTGRTLPQPVGDEVAFYYPALAFAEQNTLATNHLTSGRPLHWMPPAYPTTLGIWFKLVGAGYAQAKWLSFLFAATAFIILIRLAANMRVAPVALASIALAFCSRHAVVMGNFIRMEGLLLTLMLLAASLLWAGRRVAAFAIILGALLVHPNALYWVFAFPFLHWLAQKRGSLQSPAARWEKLLLALSVLLLIGYASYIFTVWVDFLHDWRHQFKTRNLGEGFAILLFRPDQLAFGLLSLATVWLVERIRLEDPDTPRQAIQFTALQAGLRYLLGIALVLWVMRILGQGWGYGVFNIMAVTLVVGVFITLLPALHRLFHKPAAMGAASYALAAAMVAGKVYSIPFAPDQYEWNAMVPEQALPGIPDAPPPYLTDADRVAVAQRFAQLRAELGRVPRLYTVPEGDGIYHFSSPEGRKLALHTLSVFGDWLPEYALVHTWPGERFFESNIAEVKAVCPGGKLPPPFYERGGHRYHLIDLQGRVPVFLIPEERR